MRLARRCCRMVHRRNLPSTSSRPFSRCSSRQWIRSTRCPHPSACRDEYGGALALGFFLCETFARVDAQFLDTAPLGYKVSDFAKEAAALPDPIKITSGGEAGGRFVVHWQTDPAAVDDLLALAARLKTTDAQPDETSSKHAKGEMADPDVVKEGSRSGRLRQKQKPAHTQSSPYR